MINRLVLVIIRKWKIKPSLEECPYLVLCKSLSSNQKVILRTLTLAGSKDFHQPRQLGWHAWVKKKNRFLVLLGNKLIVKRKINGSGFLNKKPTSSMNSAQIKDQIVVWPVQVWVASCLCKSSSRLVTVQFHLPRSVKLRRWLVQKQNRAGVCLLQHVDWRPINLLVHKCNTTKLKVEVQHWQRKVD